MKVSHEEFDRFWDEVLGADWYLEEGDDDTGSALVEISDMAIAWQGRGKPEPNGILNARDLADGARSVLSAVAIFKRWKKQQTTTTIVASFDVPNDQVAALLDQIKALKGKVLK